MKNFSRRDFQDSRPWRCRIQHRCSFLGRAAGANDDIRVGQIGFHGQGGSHIRSLRAQGRALGGALRRESARAGQKSPGLGRRDCDLHRPAQAARDKEVDAVSIAVPNHWHALATVWACQAGKDVYVEKPASHDLFEGRKMVEAARKYKRIVQTGTQCRSSVGLAGGRPIRPARAASARLCWPGASATRPARASA